MNDMTSSGWQRRGSSVVFHKEMLGPLIAAGCLVSLREALAWMQGWPADPPGNGETVLVGGLETCLDVMPTEEADRFLCARIKPYIQEFQSRWDQRALVFGFGCSASRFQVDPFEDVLFTGPSDKVIKLSAGLWNGAAKHDLYRLFMRNVATGKDEVGGFYVRRLS